MARYRHCSHMRAHLEGRFAPTYGPIQVDASVIECLRALGFPVRESPATTLIHNEIVRVQPMELPTSLVFYMDYFPKTEGK